MSHAQFTNNSCEHCFSPVKVKHSQIPIHRKCCPRLLSQLCGPTNGKCMDCVAEILEKNVTFSLIFLSHTYKPCLIYEINHQEKPTG